MLSCSALLLSFAAHLHYSDAPFDFLRTVHMADQGAGEDEEIICQSTEGPQGHVLSKDNPLRSTEPSALHQLRDCHACSVVSLPTAGICGSMCES